MKKDKILTLISTPQLILESLDGKATIAQARNTFKSYLDLNFKNWGLDNEGKATEKTSVQVYEITKNAYYPQMFNSLSNNLDGLCLTQNQIIKFCEKYPSHLRQDGYATFFLFKENNEYFVTRVDMCSSGLYVYVRPFKYDYFWHADYRHRLVAPQLSKKIHN